MGCDIQVRLLALKSMNSGNNSVFNKTESDEKILMFWDATAVETILKDLMAT